MEDILRSWDHCRAAVKKKKVFKASRLSGCLDFKEVISELVAYLGKEIYASIWRLGIYQGESIILSTKVKFDGITK